MTVNPFLVDSLWKHENRIC